MDIAAKLCVENLTYRDVMNEYRLLSDAHIHEVDERYNVGFPVLSFCRRVKFCEVKTRLNSDKKGA